MDDLRKQITFDLDTNALKIYYPSKSWTNAYNVIKNHMENNGFAWIQGSVYISHNPMLSRTVSSVLKELISNNKCNFTNQRGVRNKIFTGCLFFERMEKPDKRT